MVPEAGPSWMTWIGDRLHALFSFPDLENLGALPPLLLLGLAVLLAVALVGSLAYFLYRVMPTRRAAAQALPPTPLLPLPTASRFRQEAEAALAQGRLRDAVRATWQEVAWTLHAAEVAAYDEDLTNREYVDRVAGTTAAPRLLGGLRGFAHRVDVLAYGPREPEADEVVGLRRSAETLLAAAP